MEPQFFGTKQTIFTLSYYVSATIPIMFAGQSVSNQIVIFKTSLAKLHIILLKGIKKLTLLLLQRLWMLSGYSIAINVNTTVTITSKLTVIVIMDVSVAVAVIPLFSTTSTTVTIRTTVTDASFISNTFITTVHFSKNIILTSFINCYYLYTVTANYLMTALTD